MLLSNLVKNKSYTNLKDASIQCIKDINNLLLKDQQIKKIFLSGGKSLDIIKNNLSKLKLKKKYKLFLTDERVTKQKKYLNSPKIKRIKNENIRYEDNFNLENLKNLNKIDNLLPKKNYIMIIGVGEDGHVASIFNLKENLIFNKNLIFTKKTDEKFIRISLSYEYISNSKKIFILFSNNKKIKHIKNKKSIIYKFLNKNNKKIFNYFVTR